MHDAPVVVFDAEIRDEIPVVLVEVVLHPWQNVIPVDGEVGVSVRSCLFVVETHRVTQLVHDGVMLQGTRGQRYRRLFNYRSLVCVQQWRIRGGWGGGQ